MAWILGWVGRFPRGAVYASVLSRPSQYGPQRLKPLSTMRSYGTAKAVPLQSNNFLQTPKAVALEQNRPIWDSRL